MQSEEDSLIRELVDTIIREANPDTVILFGGFCAPYRWSRPTGRKGFTCARLITRRVCDRPGIRLGN